MLNILIVIIALVFSLVYGIINFLHDTFDDVVVLGMISLLLGLGILSLFKSLQYLLFFDKKSAKIIQSSVSSVNSGKIQDIGSYSKGYRYRFLIDGEEYEMPQYFHFGSKYEIGDTIKVSIISYEKKIVMPIRAVINIIFIGLVTIFISVKIATR